MRRFVLATFVALSVSGAPFVAHAQTPDPLPFALGAQAATYMPTAGSVEIRRISHLFWDAEAGAIARRQFEIHDPFGGPDLDITWQPEDPRAQDAQDIRPTGQGTLTWRRAGTAPYDTRAIVALYRGTLVAGALAGAGEFWHRSGLYYAGTFENGLFSGEGRLQRPGGDYYDGHFRDGLYHGPGRLVAADGTVFEGHFEAGVRDGTGLTAPADGRAFTSLWRGGAEVAGQRALLDGAEGLAHVQRVRAISFPDAELGVSVNQSLPSGVSPDWVVLYRGANDGQTLSVMPGARDMMAQWLGTGSLPVSGYWDASPFAYDRFQPVSLTVALNYSGNRPIQVTGGHIQVRDSQIIPQPAIELRRGSFCGTVAGDMSITNHVVNPMLNAAVSFRVPGGSAMTPPQAVPGDADRATVTPLSAVSAAGVDLNWLSGNRFSCGSGDAADCIDRIRASGAFGRVANRVYGSGRRVLMDVQGQISYSYAEASGRQVRVMRDFTVPVKVGAVSQEDNGECGAEMSEPLNLRRNPFMLAPEGTGYRLPYRLNARINPGSQAAWVFQFDAPRPSRHVFQVFLELSDGRTVATREVDLTYFTHRYDLEDY